MHVLALQPKCKTFDPEKKNTKSSRAAGIADVGSETMTHLLVEDRLGLATETPLLVVIPTLALRCTWDGMGRGANGGRHEKKSRYCCRALGTGCHISTSYLL